MRRRFLIRTKVAVWALIVMPIGLLLAVKSSADIVVLTNGGRVKGAILNANESPRKNYVVKTDSGQITIDKSQVKEVIAQSPEELEYERIRFTFPDTVEDQWKLAEWCRQKGLSQQRANHLERIVELDPNHKQARAALGYGQINGRWVRQEDVMKERGYVMYKGRWMLPQDIEIQEQKRKTEVAQKEWYLKLRRLRAQLDDRGPRGDAARQEFESLADPSAVPAIADLLRSESSDKVQMMLIAALARMKTSDAVKVLAEVALDGSNEEIRLTAVDHLKTLKDRAATGYFVEALKAKDNQRINHAGIALGELGDKSAVGPLIDALVTVHKEKIQQGGPNTFSPSFDSNGGIGFGAGSKTVIMRHNVQNRGVYEGLLKLAAGPDFGYDVRAWSRWHATQKKAAVAPARRD
jgi:HEAT repeat protein